MVICSGVRMVHFLSPDAVHLLVTVDENVVNEAMFASIYILLPYLHEAGSKMMILRAKINFALSCL